MVKGIREYLNAKPLGWTLFFGVPVLLLGLVVSLKGGLQPTELLGLALLACMITVLGIRSLKHDFDFAVIRARPWWLSIAIDASSIYVGAIGFELIAGRFTYSDFLQAGILALALGTWLTIQMKRTANPVPPPVLTDSKIRSATLPRD